MSDAATPTDAPPKKSKKMLVIAIAALVLGAGGGGGAWFFLKPKAEPESEEASSKAESKKAEQHVFLTLENFVVNLADRDTERYVQLGVVLELADKEVEAKLNAKMPAVRNQILLLVSSKKGGDLLSREGKEQLASEIALAAAQPIGWTPAEPEEDEEDSASKAKGKEGDKGRKKARAKRPPPPPNPVIEVHFSSLIVQ